MTFGEKLRRSRKEKGLTQAELAVVHGVSLPTLRKELAPVDLQEYLKHYEELERDACGSR